jgi:hypothetical protein
MTRTDEIVRNAIARGNHTIESIAKLNHGTEENPLILSETCVALSVVYLTENGTIFRVKSTGNWWLREGHSVIVRAA